MDADVVVVGAALARLRCAAVREHAGLAVRVPEASDARRRPDPHRPLSGIDYLAQLRDGFRRELLRDMGVADPGDTLGLSVTGWPLVNALTGGALLTIPVADLAGPGYTRRAGLVDAGARQNTRSASGTPLKCEEPRIGTGRWRPCWRRRIDVIRFRRHDAEQE